MKDLKNTCRLSVVQMKPILFDKHKGLEQVLYWLHRACDDGAEFVVFPELIIPGYPHGLNFGFTTGCRYEEGRGDWKRYYDNSVLIPGEETKALAQMAKSTGVWVSIGLSERTRNDYTLYNSNIIIDSAGRITSHHRKLKPTGAERNIWGDAHDHFFPVAETPWGLVGCLICWEGYMPLARMALYQKGISIFLEPNTNSNPEWQASCQHIALEGRVYVINAVPYITKDLYPNDLNCREDLKRVPTTIYSGGSCIVDPFGKYTAGPLWDTEGILTADLDMQKVPAAHMEFDVAGHYARPDVLELIIHNQ